MNVQKYWFNEPKSYAVDPVTLNLAAQQAPGILDSLFGGLTNLFSGNKRAKQQQDAMANLAREQRKAQSDAAFIKMLEGNKKYYFIAGSVVFVLLVGTIIYFKMKK